eukprot:gene3567-4717_t
MLNKICQKDGIALVNIVRKQEQEDLLRGLGAKYVCNATSPTFLEDLTQALVETGATLAFDATGGGKLAGQILGCMEAALNRTAKEYSRYGSTTHKQVYIYGGLDRGPTEFVRNFGMAWGMGGWLLFPFLGTLPLADVQRLRARVVAELARWGIVADDSAGRPLASSPPGVLVRLTLDAALDDLAPVSLLALLKDPLCTLAIGREAVVAGTAALELAALRGP